MAERSHPSENSLAMAAQALLPFGLPLLLALTAFNYPYDKYRLITIGRDYLLIVCTWRGYAIAGLFLLGALYCRSLCRSGQAVDKTTHQAVVEKEDAEPWYIQTYKIGLVLLIMINALVYRLVMLVALISLINTATYKIEFSKDEAYIHTGMSFWGHYRINRDEVDRAYYKLFRGRNYVRWDLMLDLKEGTVLHPELPLFGDEIQSYLETQWGLTVDRINE